MNVKIASLIAGLGFSTALAGAEPTVDESRQTFLSGGKKIDVEVFQPRSSDRHAAIVVVHGAAGVAFGNGYIRQLAAVFAANGYATYLVHYLDRTGQSYADDATIRRNFAVWLETINDAVSHVAAQPWVKGGRIAIFGYSLGAYLAIAQAAQDERIQAVVELAGGIDSSYVLTTKRMPPTLVLHGEEDRRVEVERAKELEALLKRLGTPYQMRLYPAEGHVLSPVAAFDALSRGIQFLSLYVK